MTTPFPTAGYNAILYVGGVSTALSGEATTELTAGHVYQITNAAKQVIDPTWTVTTSGSGVYSVNRLTGTLTFTDVQTPPVTVTGKYVPLGQILYAKDFTLNIKPKVVDSTPFYTHYENKTRVINQVSGTIGTFLAAEEVQTFSSGAAKPLYFPLKLNTGDPFLLKFYMSSHYELRVWAIVDTDAIKTAVEGLTDESVTFSGYRDAEGTVIAQVVTA